MSKKLSTQPYKGTRDFYPEDMRIRNYIFETWRKICKSYGYEEYDGPLVEDFELYAAKTGEEIVTEQLYSFEDRGGRKVAIRPEMTPTLARMVAAKHKELPRPIRWFSIPNLWRYEKPQRGRLREHYQLNIDIFGVDGVEADFEILSIATDIMLAFGAKEGMYEIRVGNRRLIEDLYKKLNITKEQGIRVSKALDKKSKISQNDFENLLKKDANLDENSVKMMADFLNDPNPTILELLEQGSDGAKEVYNLLDLASQNNKEKLIKYDPTIMRGFDYYTGNVFEQFDLNPQNNRSMYGGGRYDDLISLFTGEKLTGVGLGMGDVTLKNFLEDSNLLPNLNDTDNYLVTLWPTPNNEESQKYLKKSFEIAQKLRDQGKNVETWLQPNTKLDKQLKYADKKDINKVIIIGEEELKSGKPTVKDMKTGNQTVLENI
jgi:histidyl-tRNA synthetase